MRLLKRDAEGNVSLTKDLHEFELPPYAILSHTWGPDEEEVTFNDLTLGRGVEKKGYEKIRFCVWQTERDGLDHFWLDTCCIDKSSSPELSEALISMFRWYAKAEKCYVYLADVPRADPAQGAENTSASLEHDLRASRWFTRGWTLQELIAPRSLEFFTRDRRSIGTKGTLGRLISDVTQIQIEALQGQSLRDFSVETRLAWQARRQTKRPEDLVYSLLGLFDASMPVLYGEGEGQARRRLMRELGMGTSTLSNPVMTVPFPRNRNFAVREELAELQNKMSQPCSRVALIGLGGIGKSQLAIEYCYRLREKSPNTWIFWIHANTAARFDQDMRKLADDAKIPGREANDANICQLVYNWLMDDRNQWLIVIDNADDAEYLFEAPSGDNGNERSRIEYFPPCPHGSIISTSRWRDIASRLVDYQDVIVLQPNKEHAISLLKGKLGECSEDAAAEKLVVALDNMPLAVTQAAAYIKKMSPRCTIKDYTERLERNDRSKTTLLKSDSGTRIRNQLDVNNSVLLTWQISFDHIYRIRPSAANLLSLMSFYDYQGIPESLLQPDIENPHESLSARSTARLEVNSRSDRDDRSLYSVTDAFELDVALLQEFSFITVTSNKSILQTHRLVQLATQLWLAEKKRYEQWEAESLRRLDQAHPYGIYENREACRALQPHVKLVLSSRAKDDGARLSAASALYNAAWFADLQGLGIEAEVMVRRSFDLRISILGDHNINTLESMLLLAVTLHHQRKDRDSMEMSRLTLKRCEGTLGVEHYLTLRVTENLAISLDLQEKCEKAEDMQRRVLEANTRIYGKRNVETLHSMLMLGTMLERQGKYTEAEELGRYALEGCEEVLGKEHPRTLSSVSSLSVALFNQGKNDEAAALCQRALRGFEESYGKEHPDTLTNVGHLASIRHSQGKYREAEELYRRELDGREKTFGKEHVDTLNSVSNLALCLHNQGKYGDAEELARRALKR